MNEKIPIKELMTTNIVTVNPNEVITKIHNIFKENSFHHIPVIDTMGMLVGMISKTDLDKIQAGATLFRNPKVKEYNETIFASLLVKDIMVKGVIYLNASDPIHSAYQVFKENKFRALPILERGTLVGILTPLDLLHYFFSKTKA